VRLDGELERQLESGLALDLHAVEKGAPIETEVARRIVDRQTGEVMQRKTGKTREHHLEGRAADLSASRHVAARRDDIRARVRTPRSRPRSTGSMFSASLNTGSTTLSCGESLTDARRCTASASRAAAMRAAARDSPSPARDAREVGPWSSTARTGGSRGVC